MIVAVLRATVLYFIVLVSLRIMGKGELGELQPFDLVVSLMIAELAAMPMEDLNSPISHGITAIVTLMFLQCLTSYVALKSNKARRIICGKPSILIDHGKFNVREMNKLRVNVNDLLGQLRLKGYYNVADVDYLIMETNGQISVIASTKALDDKCTMIPVSIILDGRVMTNNLERYNISEKTLEYELKKKKINVKDVIYGFVDEKNEFIFYRRN